MELWTVEKSGGTVRWNKRALVMDGENIENCFTAKIPIEQILLDELSGGKGQRWLVFSGDEESEMGRLASLLFFSGKRNRRPLPLLLLEAIEKIVRKGWGGQFSATYISTNTPDIIADTHSLAVHIG